MRAIRALVGGPAWLPSSLAARAFGSWAQGACATPPIHHRPHQLTDQSESRTREPSTWLGGTPSAMAGVKAFIPETHQALTSTCLAPPPTTTAVAAAVAVASGPVAGGAAGGAGGGGRTAARGSRGLHCRGFASSGLTPGAVTGWAGGIPIHHAQGCAAGAPGVTGARAGSLAGVSSFPSPSFSPLAQALGSTRGVYVEVKGGSVDKAIRKYKAKLREDNIIKIARARSRHWKGAELKRLKARESIIRRKTKDFKEKLAWIMAQKAKGL